MAVTSDNHLDLENRGSWDDNWVDQAPDSAGTNSPREKLPFYGARFSRRENTWVITLFVVLQTVAFIATMFVNDCPRNSQQDCVLGSLRRFSFQPLTENPLLGPSSSTLDAIGALHRSRGTQQLQKWRLVTCVLLHAGLIHIIVNLTSVILIGIRLEQDFGPLRIGMIYLLTSFVGSLVAALFIQNSPAVGASGALFGLVGAMLSGVVRNWSIYNDKFLALSVISFVAVSNFFLGLLPHVDNFANMGGFLSGILLGSMLLFDPRIGRPGKKKGLFGYDPEISIDYRQKLDKPTLRIVALVLFILSLAGGLIAVLHGVNANNHCSWCHYINCVPIRRWSCSDTGIPCEVLKTNLGPCSDTHAIHELLNSRSHNVNDMKTGLAKVIPFMN